MTGDSLAPVASQPRCLRFIRAGAREVVATLGGRWPHKPASPVGIPRQRGLISVRHLRKEQSMNIATRLLKSYAIVKPILVAVAVGSLMVGPAHAAVSCHKINAKGAGQDLAQVCHRALQPSMES